MRIGCVGFGDGKRNLSLDLLTLIARKRSQYRGVDAKVGN